MSLNFLQAGQSVLPQHAEAGHLLRHVAGGSGGVPECGPNGVRGTRGKGCANPAGGLGALKAIQWGPGAKPLATNALPAMKVLRCLQNAWENQT